MIAGEFNAQDIANTLCVFEVTMGTKPGDRMRAGAVDGGNIRGVHLGGHSKLSQKHAVSV